MDRHYLDSSNKKNIKNDKYENNKDFYSSIDNRNFICV